ncbi:hypothetical protein BOTCAL_0099g00270 [Botryotinia calthae]|uniref:Uncharacterized protein n=1 Tax=Botryotinia calthae TaxID=38488 RepID=A0A4Y8D8H3_9HELO|nr:hypothetical protein BOTCAL_0099g00270 [Botryotinia calthae]
MAILHLFQNAFTGTGPEREKSSGIQDLSSGYTFVSEIPTDVFDTSQCKIKSLRRLITITHTSTIIVPSSTLGLVPTVTHIEPSSTLDIVPTATHIEPSSTLDIVPTVTHIEPSSTLDIVPTVTLIVPSTTKTSTPVVQPTVPPTGITAIALSEISSWNAIGATATDPVAKSILKSFISRESLAASLTPDAYTAVITISPAEETIIDQAIKDSAEYVHSTTIILSCFFVGLFLAWSYGLGWYLLRQHRRRRGRKMPPLTEYIPPQLGSLGGLMAEMGRENIVEPEGHENRADGIHRVPRVPKAPRVHSTLQELAIPEGFAELPGSIPEIKQLRHTGLQSEGEGAVNSQKILYEV